MHVIMHWMPWRWNGILFPKLFWPFVRKNWQKLMKFETEGREFAKREGGVCWKILLWFRNLQEKLENEDPGSRSWGHWSKTRWKKVSAKNCHMYLWNKYKFKVYYFNCFVHSKFWYFTQNCQKILEQVCTLGISWYLQIHTYTSTSLDKTHY